MSLHGSERRGVRDQRLTQVCGQLVHHPTGHSLAAHRATVANSAVPRLGPRPQSRDEATFRSGRRVRRVAVPRQPAGRRARRRRDRRRGDGEDRPLDEPVGDDVRPAADDRRRRLPRPDLDTVRRAAVRRASDARHVLGVACRRWRLEAVRRDRPGVRRRPDHRARRRRPAARSRRRRSCAADRSSRTSSPTWSTPCNSTRPTSRTRSGSTTARAGWRCCCDPPTRCGRRTRAGCRPRSASSASSAPSRDGGADADVEVRAFFPKDGMPAEDPVTGSLNASLGQWLIGSGRLAFAVRRRPGLRPRSRRTCLRQPGRRRTGLGGRHRPHLDRRHDRRVTGPAAAGGSVAPSTSLLGCLDDVHLHAGVEDGLRVRDQRLADDGTRSGAGDHRN